MAADGARLVSGETVIEEEPINEDDFLYKEHEVLLGQMEGRLRVMILDLIKPTVRRVTGIQHEIEELRKRLASDESRIVEILDCAKLAKQCHDMLDVFRDRIDSYWERGLDQEMKWMESSKNMMRQVEAVEGNCDRQRATCERLSDSLSRVMQDMERRHQAIKDFNTKIESGLHRNSEKMDTEVQRLNHDMQDLRDLQHRFINEVWGPEDIRQNSPLCLRRLDWHVRQHAGMLEEALESLTNLKVLDPEVKTLIKQQANMDSSLKSLSTMATQLKERVGRIAEDSKQEYKRVSNLMAAFTANMLQDVRSSFATDIKAAQQMRHDVDEFVQNTREGMDGIRETLLSNTRQVEAVLKEVRIDVENFEQKRLRDKQLHEGNFHSLQSRVVTALESSEATIRGLEHISGVISMSLQSDRMSVALDLQDFVERKETPYVGVRGAAVRGTKPLDCTRRGGIDSEQLIRLFYKPQPINIMGKQFERPHLLALREKLLHAAQQELHHGPNHRLQKQHQMMVEECDIDVPQALLVPQVVGLAAADVAAPVPRRPSSRGARPGSRGQPSARGSPMLDKDSVIGDSCASTFCRETPSTTARTASATPARTATATPGILAEIAHHGMQLPLLSITPTDGHPLPSPMPCAGY